MFADHKFSPFNSKPYKMCYIGGFIMKSIKENTNSKEFKNGMYRYILKKKEVSLGQKPERKN